MPLVDTRALSSTPTAGRKRNLAAVTERDDDFVEGGWCFAPAGADHVAALVTAAFSTAEENAAAAAAAVGGDVRDADADASLP